MSGSDGVVTTNEAVDITAWQATVTGTVSQSLLTSTSISCFGVSYGEDEDANDAVRTTNSITGTTFTMTLSSLSSETTYYYKAFVKDDNGNYIYGSTRKFTTPKTGGESSSKAGKAVDLGLPSGTKWADRNVGAANAESYGDYFAWGETSQKDSYMDNNCVTYGLNYSTLQSKGIIDSNGNLTAKYDAATVNWGKGWKTPTYAQVKELVNNCTWTWKTKNGILGYEVKSANNGNSIFLPFAGYRYGTSLEYDGSDGYYWSSTAGESNGGAYGLVFASGNNNWSSYRYVGFSVRPVSE